jgi:hypothetical protein
MGSTDGKCFEVDGTGIIRKRGWGSVTRWDEAAAKVREVAAYNMRRRMKAHYYLLNPRGRNDWVEDVDFVCIDPAQEESAHRLQTILLDSILSSNNIRGSTPLDQITSVLRTRLLAHASETAGQMFSIPVCFNIITDGEPNDKRLFEAQLRTLAHTSGLSIFLTINLCTDDDNVVEYYNDLDRTVGNELNGLEVLDDLESEQKEVLKFNSFFVYSHELHVCRMAGCNSKVADLMDEERMGVFHATKLTKELLRLAGNPTHKELPVWAHEADAYMAVIHEANKQVFDFRRGSFRPLIDERALRSKIDWHSRCAQLKQLRVSMGWYWIVAVVVLVASGIYAVAVRGGGPIE